MNINLTIEQFAKRWAVYGVYDTVTNEPIYVGCIKLTNLFTLSDFKMVLKPSPLQKVLIILINTYENKGDALIYQSKKIKELNLKIVPVVRATAVRCVNTNETFVSAQEACNSHNLTYSALINHLNRKTGHLTVKGKIYERISIVEHLRATGQMSTTPPPPQPYAGGR